MPEVDHITVFSLQTSRFHTCDLIYISTSWNISFSIICDIVTLKKQLSWQLLQALYIYRQIPNWARISQVK